MNANKVVLSQKCYMFDKNGKNNSFCLPADEL